MRKCKLADLPHGITVADDEIPTQILSRPGERGILRGTVHIFRGIIIINGEKYRDGDVLMFEPDEYARYEAICRTDMETWIKKEEVLHDPNAKAEVYDSGTYKRGSKSKHA